MYKFFSLLKVQFISYLGINKITKGKKSSKKLLGAGAIALLIGVAFVVLVYFYIKLLSGIYAQNTPVFLPTMFALSAFICLIFTFYSASSALYGFKDYDMLSAMPLKSSTVISSKIAFMYLADLLLSLAILIVSTFIYFIDLGGTDVLSVVRIFAMAFFLPFFPMVFSIIIGALFTFISSRFKRRNLIQLLLIFLLFGAIMALSIGDFENPDPFAMVKRIYFIMPWVQTGSADWLFTLLFNGVSLTVIVVVLIVICLTYKKMNTIIKAKAKSAKVFVMKHYGARSQFKALVYKEIKTLFSSSMYAANTLLGPILAIVSMVALVILAQSMPEISVLLVFFTPSIYAFMFTVAPTTNCAISIEGSAFWVIRTMPVSYRKVLLSKLSVNWIFGVVPALISSFITSFAFVGLSAEYIICNILMAILIASFAGNLGLTLNILFPNFKWENMNKVVKQSASVVLTIFSGMVLACGLYALLALVNWDLLLKLVLIVLVLTILNAITFAFIMLKGEKVLGKKV